jgi:hypothetical protein
MSQIKFQQLIDDFSPTSLIDVLKGHDFFRIKQNLLPAFSDKQFVDFNQLGDFDLEDNTNIVVISARSLTHLNERASRKAQYDISKKILKSFQKSRAGIFIYYDSKGDFRISLIYADYVGIKVNYSTFKRFTYFVSKEQTNTTFLQYVAPLSFTNFQELKEIFSVEKVTKEFFEKYRDLFIETLEDFNENKEFQNVVVDTNISTTADFVKKLMGQIVFLYFVQKKGWLGVRCGDNWGSGDQAFLRNLYTSCIKSNKNYFNDYLEQLFYKALAEKNEDDYFELCNCKVPFLNGGLFESVYDWQNTKINIPNKTIGKLLDFFDQYNFTVDENTPSDQEISVDPEMLGKIFENLLNIKDRKDKGAFYTPREIVHYMCRESLIQHLVSEKVAPEERIRKIFEIKDTDLSVLIENEKKAEIIKKLPDLKEIAEKADLSLRNVRIVDPAVGSGAFPMGMLNEISSVRYFLNTNFLYKVNETKKELSLYDIKKETLENCIYAVDIEPGAVEIAKLRFWLALIVEYESNNSDIAPPTLPNLDYKIMQGNSLLEEYEGIKLFDEKIITTIDTDKEKQIDIVKQKQAVLQKEYIKLHSQNKLTPIKKAEFDLESKKLKNQLIKFEQVEKVTKDNFGLFDVHSEAKKKADELKSLQKQFFETNQKITKDNTRKQIEKLEWELIEVTLKEQGKTFELSKFEELKKSKTKPFFLWRLHFSDVFERKGGFDIVIGNPPYVNTKNGISEEDKEVLKKKFITAIGQFDLFTIFMEMGLKISNNILTYIIPKPFINNENYQVARELIIKNGLNEIITGSNVFESVGVESCIFRSSKNNSNNNVVIKEFIDGNFEVKNIAKADSFLNLPFSVINTEITQKDESILEKINIQTTLVKDVLDITRGVECGKKDSEINDIKSEYLLLRGEDIGKWYTTVSGYYINFDKRDNKKFKPLELYKGEKILIRRVSDKIIATIDETDSIVLNTIYCAKSKNELQNKYIVSILNSSLISFFFNKTFILTDKLFPYLRKSQLDFIPIKKASKLDQKPFIDLVDKILNITKTNDYLNNTEKQTEVKKLEHQIDELVYKLYGLMDDEIKIVEAN